MIKSKQLDYFKCQFAAQQVKDDQRLQERITELKTNLRDQIDESIKNENTKQVQNFENTIEKLQTQINNLKWVAILSDLIMHDFNSRLLEERQAARVKQHEIIEPVETPPETTEVVFSIKNCFWSLIQTKRRTPTTVRIEDTYGVERKSDKMSAIQEQPSSHAKVLKSSLMVF